MNFEIYKLLFWKFKIFLRQKELSSDNLKFFLQ